MLRIVTMHTPQQPADNVEGYSLESTVVSVFPLRIFTLVAATVRLWCVTRPQSLKVTY